MFMLLKIASLQTNRSQPPTVSLTFRTNNFRRVEAQVSALNEVARIMAGLDSHVGSVELKRNVALLQYTYIH